MVGVRWRRVHRNIILKRFRVYVIVPSPPVSLLDRVRFIEDHIMRLERDYPPWAALHFNQPNRGVRPDTHFFVRLDS